MLLQWLLLGVTEKSSEFQVGIKPNNSLSYSFILCQATTYHYNISRSSALQHFMLICMQHHSYPFISYVEWKITLSSRQCQLDTLCKKNQVERCSSSGVLVVQWLNQHHRGHRFNSEMDLWNTLLPFPSTLSKYHDIHFTVFCIIIIMIMIITCCWPQTCSSDTSIVGSWGKLALSSLGCPTCQSFIAASARWFIPSPINQPAVPPAGGTSTSAYPCPTREGPCQTQHLLVLTLIFLQCWIDMSASQIGAVETQQYRYVGLQRGLVLL